MTTPNSNRVPLRQWRKWSEPARYVFNEVYCFVAYNQELTVHPKQKAIPDEQWVTIAWNAAWIAADAVDDTVPKKGATFVDIESKTGREVVRRVVQ